MEDVAAGMMVPLCLHWYTKEAVPEAEHLSVVEVPSCTVFEVSPESVMRTSEGGAAINICCGVWYIELLTLQAALNERHTFSIVKSHLSQLLPMQ